MPTDKKQYQIFLSYNNENIEIAYKIYDGLKKRGLIVWFDKVDLRPGSWKQQVKTAIYRSRYFVICLSNQALRRINDPEEGFQSEELDLALEITQQQPESEFTIVPLRLEDCERGDSRLSSYQQYELFRDFEREIDRLSIHLGGKAISDTEAKDQRSFEHRKFDALWTKAKAASESGDWETAYSTFTKLTEENPILAEAWNGKGVAQNELNLYSDAIKSFDHAIKLDPSIAITLINKGNALERLGRPQDALKIYNQAIAINPNDPLVYYNMGITLDLLGDPVGAVDAYNKVIKINPQDALTWHKIGSILDIEEKSDEAIEAYKKVTRIKPNWAEVWYRTGQLLAQKKEYLRACEAFNNAVKIKSNSPKNWWYELAICLVKLERRDEASTAFDRATEQQNKLREEWWYFKGENLARLGRHYHAVKAFERASGFKSDTVQTWNTKGKSYSIIGQYKNAINAFRRTIEIDPRNFLAWFSIGVISAILHENSEAVEAVEKALKLRPNYNPAKRLKANLLDNFSSGILSPQQLNFFLSKNPSQIAREFGSYGSYNLLSFGGGSCLKVVGQYYANTYGWNKICFITNASDNGGSTYKITEALRPEYGHTIPVGDITSALISLMEPFCFEIMNLRLWKLNSARFSDKDIECYSQMIASQCTFAERLDTTIKYYRENDEKKNNRLLKDSQIRFCENLLILGRLVDKFDLIRSGIPGMDLSEVSIRHHLFVAIMIHVGAYNKADKSPDPERFYYGLLFFRKTLGIEHDVYPCSIDEQILYAEWVDNNGNIVWSTKTKSTQNEVLNVRGQVALSNAPDSVKRLPNGDYARYGYFGFDRNLPTPSAYSHAVQSIARLEPGSPIIFGPSSFVASISPCLAIKEIVREITKRTDCPKILCINLTLNNETIGWQLNDFIEFWELNTGRPIAHTVDYVVVDDGTSNFKENFQDKGDGVETFKFRGPVKLMPIDRRVGTNRAVSLVTAPLATISRQLIRLSSVGKRVYRDVPTHNVNRLMDVVRLLLEDFEFRSGKDYCEELKLEIDNGGEIVIHPAIIGGHRLRHSTILLISISPGSQKQATEELLRIITKKNLQMGRSLFRGHILRCVGKYTLLLAIDSDHVNELISWIHHISGVRKIGVQCGVALHLDQDGFDFKLESNQPNQICYPLGAFVFLKICNHLLRTIGSDMIQFSKDIILDKLKDIGCVYRTPFDEENDFTIDIFFLEGAYELLCIVRTKDYDLLHKISYYISHTLNFEKIVLDVVDKIPSSEMGKVFKERQSELQNLFFSKKYISLFSMSISLEGFTHQLMYDSNKFMADYYEEQKKLYSATSNNRAVEKSQIQLQDCKQYNTESILKIISPKNKTALTAVTYCRAVTGNAKTVMSEISESFLLNKEDSLQKEHLISPEHFSITVTSDSIVKYLEQFVGTQKKLQERYNRGQCPIYSTETQLKMAFSSPENERWLNDGFDDNVRFSLEDKFKGIVSEDFRTCLKRIIPRSKPTYNILANMFVKYHRCFENNQIYLYFIPMYDWMVRLRQKIMHYFGDNDYNELPYPFWKILDHHFCGKSLDRVGKKDLERVHEKFKDLKDYFYQAASFFEMAYDQFFSNSNTIGTNIDDSSYGFLIGYQSSLLEIWGLFAFLLNTLDRQLAPRGFCLLGTKDSIEYDPNHRIIFSPNTMTHQIEKSFLLGHEAGHEVLDVFKEGHINDMMVILFPEVFARFFYKYSKEQLCRIFPKRKKIDIWFQRIRKGKLSESSVEQSAFLDILMDLLGTGINDHAVVGEFSLPKNLNGSFRNALLVKFLSKNKHTGKNITIELWRKDEWFVKDNKDLFIIKKKKAYGTNIEKFIIYNYRVMDSNKKIELLMLLKVLCSVKEEYILNASKNPIYMRQKSENDTDYHGRSEKFANKLKNHEGIVHTFDKFHDLYRDVFCDLFSFESFFSFPLKVNGLDKEEDEAIRLFIITHFHHIEYPYSLTKYKIDQALYRSFCVFQYAKKKSAKNDQNHSEHLDEFITLLKRIEKHKFYGLTMVKFLERLNDPESEFQFFINSELHKAFFNIVLTLFTSNLRPEKTFNKTKKELNDNEFRVTLAIVESLKEWEITYRMRYIERIYFENAEEKQHDFTKIDNLEERNVPTGDKKEQKIEFRRHRFKLVENQNLIELDNLQDEKDSPKEIVDWICNKLPKLGRDTVTQNIDSNRRNKIKSSFRNYAYLKIDKIWQGIE